MARTQDGKETGNKLSSTFFSQPTEAVAQQMLGTVVVRILPGGEELRGIVVEVEAYLSRDDAASHSFRGPGKKNASMFCTPGTLYVYCIHARHCMNVVTEAAGQGAAVLIRALEPLQGLDRMANLRFGQASAASLPRVKRHQLTQGPGRLCEALDIDRTADGLDLLAGGQIWLEHANASNRNLPWKQKSSARIGISQARNLKLRWFIDGNRFVSGRAKDHTHGRTWSFSELRDKKS